MRRPALPLLLSLLWSPVLHASEEGDAPPAPTPSQARSPLTGEAYLSLFAGNLNAGSDTVTATTQCFFCPPVSATHAVSYNSGKMSGLRAGYWLGKGRFQGGLLFELARGDVEGDLAEASYTAFHVAPALRVRLPQPGQRLDAHVYGGLLLGAAREGEARVNFPEFPQTAGGPVEGNSSGVLAGLSLGYGRLVLSADLRRVSTRLKFNYLGDSGELRLAGRQTLVSAGWKF